MENANNILFRSSSNGLLMTEPRSKSELISETTKGHLIDVFVSNKYGREDDIQNKYITKGLEVEEDSITLFSRHTKTFYKKNEERIYNEFVAGTPDLYEGDGIKSASMVIDIKSSWDIFTFFRNTPEKLNKLYYWQLQSYMWLTGAKSAKLVYCLTDTPLPMIEDEKRRLMWKMGVATSENPDYLEACEKLEKNLLYPDIPIKERVKVFDIERNDVDIERLKQRVIQCREWMNENLFRV